MSFLCSGEAHFFMLLLQIKLWGARWIEIASTSLGCCLNLVGDLYGYYFCFVVWNSSILSCALVISYMVVELWKTSCERTFSWWIEIAHFFCVNMLSCDICSTCYNLDRYSSSCELNSQSFFAWKFDKVGCDCSAFCCLTNSIQRSYFQTFIS